MPNIIKPSGLNQLWAAGGTKVDPGLAKTNIGWVVELPPYQYQNWLDNKQDTFIAHTNQHGIPEWDDETEYQGNLSYTQGSDGLIYKCLQTHTNLNPANPLNSSYWVRAFEPYGSVAVVQNALAAHILNYQTLSGISNPVAARNNLSVWSKAESDTRFAFKAGDAAQVFSVAVATQPEHAVRLGQVMSLIAAASETVQGIIQIATAGEVSTGTNDTKAVTPLKLAQQYLSKAGNLAGLANQATSRTNLGLGTMATEDVGSFLRTTNNLSDLTNASVARTNLGLTSTATQPETYFLRSANNFSDLTNVTTARNNLGLGNSATRDVGTTAGTVAAGDDSRIVNAVPNTRQVVAGNGLTGGGALNTNVTVNLGTPSTLTASTANSVSTTSHSHAVDINSFFGPRSLGTIGHYEFPGGLILQWGVTDVIGVDGSIVVTFPRAFDVACFQVIACGTETPTDDSGSSMSTRSLTATTCIISNNHRPASNARWFAIGR